MLSSPLQSVKQLAMELNFISSPSASDDDDLADLCRKVIETMPSEVAALRSGHRGVVNKLVGSVMKQTRGRVDANTAKAVILKILQEET